MKHLSLAVILLSCIVVGCRPSEDEIRRIVREEMGQGLQKKIVKPVSVIGPYSPAVRVGGFLFVSGQIGLDPETGVFKGDNIESETRQVLDNLARILRAEGYDSSHVVSATVYLKNINDYQRMNQVYGGFFREGNYPARVAVEVGNLPRQANVEISVIAYKP
jgi:2-iminobutanoate/2-iminopropanoate deaminase